jgi:hypothetical protein
MTAVETNSTTIWTIMLTPRKKEHGAGGGADATAAEALLRLMKILQCWTAGLRPAAIVAVEIVSQGSP